MSKVAVRDQVTFNERERYWLLFQWWLVQTGRMSEYPQQYKN